MCMYALVVQNRLQRWNDGVGQRLERKSVVLILLLRCCCGCGNALKRNAAGRQCWMFCGDERKIRFI
jgi:hypothetical protein